MTRGDHGTLGGLMRASMLDGRSRAGFHIYGGARGPDAKANFDKIGEAELFGDAAIFAAALREQGVVVGDYCLIACSSLQMTISSFFAAVALGVVPMIQPEAHALGGDQSLATRMNTLCGRLGDRTWILMEVNDTTETLGGIGRTDGIIPLHSSGPAAKAALPPDEFHVAHLEDVAFLQATSGTTGTGNLVAVPHRSVFAQVEAIMHAGWDAHDVFSNWAPSITTSGL